MGNRDERQRERNYEDLVVLVPKDNSNDLPRGEQLNKRSDKTSQESLILVAIIARI